MAATSETLPHLFDVVRAEYPESVGPERWYLIAVSHGHALLPAILTRSLFSCPATSTDDRFQLSGVGSHNKLRPFQSWSIMGLSY